VQRLRHRRRKDAQERKQSQDNPAVPSSFSSSNGSVEAHGPIRAAVAANAGRVAFATAHRENAINKHLSPLELAAISLTESGAPMGGLRDQLLKAGLVNEKQVKKAQQEKRKENRQQGQGKANAAAEEKQRLQQAMAAEKAERDRQLNLQRKQEAEKKAVAAQIKQLIETNRQPKEEGDTPFNFADGSTVKRLYLSDRVRERIVRGQLAIVRLEGRYELVPPEIADKIRQRDAGAVVLQNEPPRNQAQDQGDDPYAAYQVPDDLMW
jgi:uncharacterized protein YaiL (DUF2058 family)